MLLKVQLLAFVLFFTFPASAQQSLPEVISKIDTVQNPADKLLLIELGTSLLESEPSDSVKADFYLRCGITYGISGKADSAIVSFKKALELAVPLQHLLRSRCHSGMGNVNRAKGNNDEALGNFQAALKEVEGKQDMESRSFEGSVIANLSGIYFGMGDMTRAEVYSRRSIDHARTLDDSGQLAYSYVGLALILNAAGDYEGALESHNLAAGLIEKVGIDYLRDYNKINLAKLHEKRGETEESLRLYNEMLDSDNPDMDVRTTSFTNAAKIYFNEGSFHKSIEYASRSLQLTTEIGMLPAAVESCKVLYESHQALGEYKAAAEYMNRYISLNDSLRSEKAMKALSELETKYETERKEQEITALKLENQESANQRNIYLFVTILVIVGAIFLGVLIRSKTKSNLLISKSLKEKELLLKEIHHRVKNNLQIISSLLSLQSRFIEDQGAKDAVNEGQNRVKSMALIHQKLYQNESQAGVEALDYIENLTSTLRSTYGVDPERVAVHYDVDRLNIDVDTIIPIGLILNELISNAFKHAFPDNKEGQVTVGLRRKDNLLELKVTDNGVGTSRDITKSDSFGLRMIRSLAMKLEATVDFNFSNGTEASLVISSFKLV